MLLPLFGTTHRLETVRLPLQVHVRGTVYGEALRSTSKKRSLPSKNNLNRFLDSHSACDNVIAMLSALAMVRTAK